MKRYWQGLSSREQRLALVVALVLLAFIFWLALWRPLSAAHAGLDTRIERQQQDLAWMRAAALEATRLQGQPTTTGNRGDLSLLALAEQSARGIGLAEGFRRGEPVGDARVRVTFEAVSFDRLIQWVEMLNQRYGVTVDELAVDRAGSPGLVDARVMLAE